MIDYIGAVATLAISTRATRVIGALFPAVPDDIREAMLRFQYQAVRRQIPSLHLTALVNVGIVIAVLWHVGAPLAHYAWMPIIGLFNLYRILLWRAQGDAVPAEPERFLRKSSAAAILSVLGISAYSVWSYLLGVSPYPVLIPVSLAFGSLSIAHGLASMRAAASAVVVAGIFPSAAIMLLSGDFLSICLGSSAATVALLQLRFLAEHQAHIRATLALQQEVEQLANRDALTGLLNRRAFLAAWDAVPPAPPGRARALLVLDIDHFKTINDRFGHDVGDRVLFQFAGLLAAAAHERDIIARFGGEEFVALAEAASEEELESFAERLCRAVSLHAFGVLGRAADPVTVSIGLRHLGEKAGDFDAAFAEADAALYAAKAAGRNRVRIAGDRVAALSA